MSDFTQPGQHPDADQLSAFAEDALPAHEREQTLAHLAGCADCRTIVSLALPPMEDVPQLRPAAARRPWFYGWNMAWLAGAGLTALIFLTVHIHNSERDGKTAGTPTQTAEVRPEAAPQAPPTEPMASNAAPEAAKKTASPIAVPGATDSVESLKTPPTGATVNNQQIANLPVQGRRFIAQPQQQQMTQQQQVQQQQAGASHGSVFGAAAGAGVAGGVPRDDRSPFAQRSPSNESNKDMGTAYAASPAPVAAPPVSAPHILYAPAPPAADATSAPPTSDTITVDAAATGMETKNASVSTVLSTAGLVPVRNLPSHLAIVSAIIRANQMLALDTAGALFLSADGGHHWKAVTAQWPGRAVKVELASPPLLPAKQPASDFGGRSVNGSTLSGLDLKPVPTPSIIGVVTDPTGAIIPGATIRVTDTRTGIIRTTASDRSGRYTVGGLTPDAYRIDASAQGFQSWQSTVTLAAAQQSIVNIPLMIGAANETVEVTAEAPMATDKAERKVRRAAKDVSLSELPVIFEITTDGGEIWTSADGKSWKRK